MLNTLILQISRHSIESCPLNNKDVKKVYQDSWTPMVPLMTKHGIKLVGGWASVFEHLYAVVYDVPNMEAFLAFSMEPEIMSLNQYNDNEVLPVMTLEEVMNLLSK